MSAGQALRPQWAIGLVPAEISTAELKPSQSGSLSGTRQGGSFWVAFGQLGQLSVMSGTPSASLSAPSVGDGVEVGVSDAVGVAVRVWFGVAAAVRGSVGGGGGVGVPPAVGAD